MRRRGCYWWARTNGRLSRTRVCSQTSRRNNGGAIGWRPRPLLTYGFTVGLARYSEGLYVEEISGKEALNKALEDFAVGALMFDDSAPIAQAGRLEPESEDYRSVAVNKGAMVFHMLRAQLGDTNFFALLKDFYARYSGKAAHIEDFEKLAEAHAGQTAAPEFKVGNAAPTAPTGAVNLRPFFTQWLRSTGRPGIHSGVRHVPDQKGFRIVGKAKQNLELFNMDIEIQVQTEGNPELKTIQVAGKESAFTVETFGRPKPNGIILDPHNFILKSSQRLRVRGIIARGESLAELGRYYDAVQQYQRALDLERNNALAEFRMGEAFFYQRNYAASAQSFRDALEGQHGPHYPVDGSVVAHLSWPDLRHYERPHTRGQRIQQGQANWGRYRRRAGRSGKVLEETLLRNRIVTSFNSRKAQSAADFRFPCAG